MTDFTQDVEQCLKVLEAGGVILYPTDTIWGLGCDATNADAVA
jgi:L-threonylcarbamoyladenylate synthase